MATLRTVPASFFLLSVRRWDSPLLPAALLSVLSLIPGSLWWQEHLSSFSVLMLLAGRQGGHPVCTGFRKTLFFKKAQPTGFLGFIGFLDFFLFEQAVRKLVGWCSSSAKLLFRFTSTLDYLKICKFVAFWSLEVVNIKKSLIITYYWHDKLKLN